MRKILLLIVLSLFTKSYGQIRMMNDKKEVLDEFKGTETIFILSNIYDTKLYEDILKETWTITPFKVIKYENFNPLDYFDGKHSFALLNAYSRVSQNSFAVYGQIRFSIYKIKGKLKEIEKYNKMPDKKKGKYDLLLENRIDIASIPLQINELFVYNSGMLGNVGKLGTAGLDWDNYRSKIYDDEMFDNYSPGFLKNYFQKLNGLIIGGKVYGMGFECLPEIKKLKKATLYVPDYLGKQYDRVEAKDGVNAKHEKMLELFEKYKYKYEYIEMDELSNKIMAGEEIYYLRYVYENGGKFTQVVNSKTGEIVYKNYNGTFLNPKLTKENMEDIKKAIDTGKI